MTASKIWKQSLEWYSIWLQPKYAAKTIANDKLWLTFENSVETCVDWTSFNFLFKDFFEQSAKILLLKKHLLCFWPTIYFSVLKSCPKFKFSVLIFLWEMTKWWALSKTICKVKICQYQPMSNAIICCKKRFAVKILKYLIWARFSTGAIRKLRRKSSKPKSWFKVASQCKI